MPGSEPSWWYHREARLAATLLKPASWVYGTVAARRIRQTNGYRPQLPVVCIGNFTAGGTGKTPLAIALSRIVSQMGFSPWFLSRGYGGGLTGPICVDTAQHTASDVGDEPLLLARYAPTIIARDRREGAAAIEAMAPQNGVIIMDDGLQNPSLKKDLSIAIIDRGRGLGNGLVIPSGPLRAPLESQIPLADIIALTGATTSAGFAVPTQISVPVISATTVAETTALNGKTVLAYAGIANPARFFSMLEREGARIAQQRIFADHHAYTEADAASLLSAAQEIGASLVTTEKDLARLSGATGQRAALLKNSNVLKIKTQIDAHDLTILEKLLNQALSHRSA